MYFKVLKYILKLRSSKCFTIKGKRKTNKTDQEIILNNNKRVVSSAAIYKM